MSRNSESMQRSRDRALQTLDRLTAHRIADLTRRAGVRATKAESDSGPKAKGSHSDPVLNAVVRSMSKNRPPDPVYDTVEEIAKLLLEMAKAAMMIDEKVRFVVEGKERFKEEQTANCKVCERVVFRTPKDRIRSGMCQACYAAARRKTPDKTE